MRFLMRIFLGSRAHAPGNGRVIRSVLRLFLPMRQSVARLGWFGAAILVAVTTARGQEEPELSVTIRGPAKEVKQGDTIPIEFTIRNAGKRSYAYEDRDGDRSGRMDEYELQVWDASGRRVRDPRANWFGLGGGPSVEAELAPGAAFRKTIVLNLWAFMPHPGRYRVMGVYHTDCFREDAPSFRSAEFVIEIEPRSEEEMIAHIARLGAALKGERDSDKRAGLVQALMHTCREEAIPHVIEAWYSPLGTDGFWEADALECYLLPKDGKERLLAIATRRGLAPQMGASLGCLGASPEEMFPTIARSLAEDNPERWSEGAITAQNYPDDRHTARLADICKKMKGTDLDRVIHALACNRTVGSVEALRQLLADERESVRKTTRKAILLAYQNRHPRRRPFRDDDFPEIRKEVR